MRNQLPNSYFHSVLKYLNWREGWKCHFTLDHPPKQSVFSPALCPGTWFVIFILPWQSGRAWAFCRIPTSGFTRHRFLGGLHMNSDFLTFSGARLAKCSLRLSHWLMLIISVQLPKVHEGLIEVLVPIYLFFRLKISTLAQLFAVIFHARGLCAPGTDTASAPLRRQR